MYEVYTLGNVPYNQKWPNLFLLKQLKSGYRLEKPEDCSDDMWVIEDIKYSLNALLEQLSEIKCTFLIFYTLCHAGWIPCIISFLKMLDSKKYNLPEICFLISRYKVMLKCWQENPKNRPTFKELVKIFGNKLDALTRKSSLDAGYIDDLLLSDASAISNLAFELDTVIEDELEDENGRYVDPEVDKVCN